MSADIVSMVELIRTLEMSMATERAVEVARRGAEAAEKHKRKPMPAKPVEAFLAKPLPTIAAVDGALHFDVSGPFKTCLSFGTGDDGPVPAATYKHAAARCLATARMLLEKAGEK